MQGRTVDGMEESTRIIGAPIYRCHMGQEFGPPSSAEVGPWGIPYLMVAQGKLFKAVKGLGLYHDHIGRKVPRDIVRDHDGGPLLGLLIDSFDVLCRNLVPRILALHCNVVV
jgi:hypothetical protein